jgi:hypothetical protein
MSTPPWGSEDPDQPPPPPGPGPYQPYGSQPNPYGGGAPYQQPRSTNGMAIASMVTSLVGVAGCLCYGLGGILGLVGAILGHVSLRQVKQRGQQGRGMALTGVIVGWVVFALAIIGWIVLGILIANEWDTTCPTSDPDYPFC